MYIPRYPTLWPKYLFSRRENSFPFPLDQGNIIFYDRGRSALLNAMKILGLIPGDKVLMPSYTCFDAVVPFLKSGIDIEYYKINKDLSIDRQDLEQRIANSVKALFFVHYFGFPQDLNYITALKNTYNFYLIEDCAHAFLSNINDVPLGSVGDVCIFSLRKIIPVRNVGILMVRNADIESFTSGNNRFSVIFKSILSQLLENIKFRTGVKFLTKNVKKVKNNAESVTFKGDYINTCPEKGWLSKINRMLLQNLDYTKIKRIRRANFQILSNWVNNRTDIIPLYDSLADGVSPMAFPVILKNRNMVCEIMNNEGIDVYPWPFLPARIKNNYNDYKDTQYLSYNILLLPIHQDLNEGHLSKIYKSLDSALACTKNLY